MDLDIMRAERGDRPAPSPARPPQHLGAHRSALDRLRGPVGAMTDEELLTQIRGVLAESPFVGEGRRKLWAGCARKGVCTSRKRVLKPHARRGAGRSPQVRRRAARLHEGTITVTVPDTLWATDATEGWSAEGRSAICAIVDHASGEVFTDASLRMDRFARLRSPTARSPPSASAQSSEPSPPASRAPPRRRAVLRHGSRVPAKPASA